MKTISVVTATVRRFRSRRHAWALRRLKAMRRGSILEFMEYVKITDSARTFRYVKSATGKISWKNYGYEVVSKPVRRGK